MQASTKRLWFLCINASLGGFQFGYTLVVFNVTQENVSHTLGWGEDEELYLSISAGLFFLAGWLGSFASGRLANSYGRRKGLMASSFTGAIGGLLSAIPHTSIFISGRFISGLSTGLFLAIGPIYISEMSPPSLSGKSGSLFGLQVVNGIITSAMLGLLLPEDTSGSMNNFWMFMYAFQCCFLLPQLFLLQFVFKFDTPYWHIMQGDIPQARASMQQLGRIDTMSSLEKPSGMNTVKASYKDLFCSKRYSKLMRVGMVVVFTTNLNGIIFFNLYSTFIFNEIGYSMFYSRLFTMAAGFSEYFGILFLNIFINKLGRKTILIGGLLLIVLDFAAISFFLEIVFVDFMIVILCVFYKVITGASAGPLSYIYMSEILDSKEIGFLLGIAWILDVIIGTISLYSIDLIGIYGNFLIYCGICSIFAVHLIFDMIETQNLTREEIKALYFGQFVAPVSKQNDMTEIIT